MIAAVTDLAGTITGVHRTWLDPSGCDKAPIATPRKALGHLLGHGVRFGCAADILAAGEGIETMLSLRLAMPALPMIAALSAAHLAAMLFPATLRRLYIARDADPAGDGAAETLTDAGDRGRHRGDHRCRRTTTTSTPISGRSASTSFAPACGRNSSPRTSRGSCCRRRAA